MQISREKKFWGKELLGFSYMTMGNDENFRVSKWPCPSLDIDDSLG